MSQTWQDRFNGPAWSFALAVHRFGIPWHQTPLPPEIDQLGLSYMLDVFAGATTGSANVHGIWLSPVAEDPLRTAAHELAHVLLGHIVLPFDSLPPGLRRPLLAVCEIEAETVAILVMTRLGCPEADNHASWRYINTFLDQRGMHYLSSPDTLELAADIIVRAGTADAAIIAA